MYSFLCRKRLLQYPALVNCTTIDWFCEWPRDALLEVAERFLDGLDLGSSEGVRSTNPHCLFLTFIYLCLSSTGLCCMHTLEEFK